MGNRGASKLNSRQLRKASDDAIAFLHFMRKLMHTRGMQEVHEQFASQVLWMADMIVAPDPDCQDARLGVATGVSEFLEAFERVPASLFKEVLVLVERKLRENVEEVVAKMADTKRAA